MGSKDVELMGHLMRRAGFGAGLGELEARGARGYEATVDELVATDSQDGIDDDLLFRYHPDQQGGLGMSGVAAYWLYRMVNTRGALHEKMTLFWHSVFATGYPKVTQGKILMNQLAMFRKHGMGSFQDLLVELSRDPAMIMWLDNEDNHAGAINENYGRELLELFSMGVGNYTEKDVYECSRAFTGWSIKYMLPRFPMGRFEWEFEYNEEFHDNTEKEFLGNVGNFNGEDVIDIICQQPATANFVSRHLYNFFVADEPQVPAWSVTPPRDPEAIETLSKAFVESGYDIKSVLRTLFNSDFFKNARFSRIKSPTEVVVGTLRQVGGYEFPFPGIGDMSRQYSYMGQDLLNPPSVEGWHTGKEWINSGSLMRRINFSADMYGDADKPGVKKIIERVRSQDDQSPEAVVDTLLRFMGPLEVDAASREELLGHAAQEGVLRWDDDEAAASTLRVTELLQVIVSLRDYQYA